MKIIDGKAHAAALRAELKEKIEEMERKPALAVVIVGEDPASQIYVRNKIKACGELGIRSLSYELPINSTQEEVVSCSPVPNAIFESKRTIFSFSVFLYFIHSGTTTIFPK